MADYIKRDKSLLIWLSNSAYEQVQKVPAADVVEVRHGRWIYNNMGGWKCSECNNQAPFWCMASTQNLSDYCPNCGAKMMEDHRTTKRLGLSIML